MFDVCEADKPSRRAVGCRRARASRSSRGQTRWRAKMQSVDAGAIAAQLVDAGKAGTHCGGGL